VEATGGGGGGGGLEAISPVAQGGGQDAALARLLHVDVQAVGGGGGRLVGLQRLQGVGQDAEVVSQGLQVLTSRV